VSTTTSAQAQLKTPSASPLSTVTQTVGITEIKLTYSRPSTNDRLIFAKNGLVPYGEYWRLGANSPTTIEISDDIKIEEQTLTVGKYVMLAIPNQDQWNIKFYEKEKGGWNKYIDRTPVLSVTANATETPHKLKSMMIYFDDLQTESASLVIHWDKTIVTLPIEVEVHEQVMKDINKIMSGPSDIDRFYAASYLYSADVDLKRALAYIQVATKGDKPTFFYARREATILAKLGKYQEAIEAAEASTKLAEKVGNIDVIKLNNESIKEWKMKVRK